MLKLNPNISGKHCREKICNNLKIKLLLIYNNFSNSTLLRHRNLTPKIGHTNLIVNNVRLYMTVKMAAAMEYNTIYGLINDLVNDTLV